MKALIFHAAQVGFLNERQSTRPRGIAAEAETLGTSNHENVAVAFVCVELGDAHIDVNSIFEEACKYGKMVNRKIVLVPFAHLSSSLAPPREAKFLLGLLCNKLQEHGILEGASSFGTHKTIDIHRIVTHSHPGDVVFRDSKFNLGDRNGGPHK